MNEQPLEDAGATAAATALIARCYELLASDDFPAVVSLDQVVNGLALTLLGLLATAPAEYRELVYRRVVGRLEASHLAVFEQWDKRPNGSVSPVENEGQGETDRKH